MNAVIIDIADAVVAAINAASLGVGVDAVRYYLPRFDLEDMTDLHMSVVPRSRTIESSDRAKDQCEYQIDVAIQRRVKPIASELDPLMLLSEQVGDLFRDTRRLGTFPSAVCVGVRNEPIYAPDHLEQFGQFTSVITLTFRLWR